MPNKQGNRPRVLLLFNVPPYSVSRNPRGEYSQLSASGPDPHGILHCSQLQWLQQSAPASPRLWQSTCCRGQPTGLAILNHTTKQQQMSLKETLGDRLALIQIPTRPWTPGTRTGLTRDVWWRMLEMPWSPGFEGNSEDTLGLPQGSLSNVSGRLGFISRSAVLGCRLLSVRGSSF